MEGTGQLTLVLDSWPALDAGQRQELTRQLRREVLYLDVESVESARTAPAPIGSKGGAGAEAAGTLLVVAALTRPLLKALVDVTRAWLERSGQRSIRIVIDGDELEVHGGGPRQTTHVADAFIDRHCGR